MILFCYGGVLVLIIAALALSAVLHRRTWRWRDLCFAFIKSAFGIILPLLAFLASSWFTPDWKGACHWGWIDCFHVGKFALLPVVLWATAALYASDVWRVERPTRTWIVLGLFLGAVVSTVCLVHGLVTIVPYQHDRLGLIGMLVPVYTAIWYVLRAVQRIRAASLPWTYYVLGRAGSLPFWMLSVYYSRRTYALLPDQHPTCFVVTAAAHGHEDVVGPFVTLVSGGHHQRINAQLLTLWAFEAAWQAQYPRSHRIFRRLYNVIGPMIARRVQRPWIADLVYLAIKPVEIMARMILAVEGRTARRTV